jgi:poly-gamma-glutamate capsule biosynthesis protein CapA/YwtB (metallophosphatase superfamily)
LRRWVLVAFLACCCVRSVIAAEVRLAAVGDVLLARGVGKAIHKHGASYPLSKAALILRKADLTFFNLECPLTRRGTPTHFIYLFRANPNLAFALKRGGLNVASLANNHTLDYGRVGLVDTITALRKAGVYSVGAGANRDQAIRLLIVRKNGLRVGFLAYSDICNFGSSPRSDRPTPALVQTDTLGAEIHAVRAKADVLIVSFHWGNQYWLRPSERQRKLARIAIDNGADLVIGHHPHVLQPYGTYRGKPIIYSLGGFVWDPDLPDRAKTAVYVFSLRRHSVRLASVIPMRVVRCRPQREGGEGR